MRAIKKYAKEQQNALQREVDQLKDERLKETEQKAKRDSRSLIKQKLREKNNEKTAQLAQLTQEGQKKLFIERLKMTDEVFRKAQVKLVEYTETAQYSQKLLKSAADTAEYFGENDCVLYINERDMNAADDIKALFKGNAEIKVDKTIDIGGIKGYCESMGIIIDETLDTKLKAQREWFVENCSLSVL